MPWQQQVADIMGEIDPVTGRMAYDLVVVTVPRQSGKTALVRSLCLQRAMVPGGRAWYTAQSRNDARDAWLDAVELVARSPLRHAVTVRLTNGSESLSVRGAGTFRVFAPLAEALHGRQADLVVLDEAWAHTMDRGRELMQAIVPTMATRARPQTLVLSTAGTDESEYLREFVRRGREECLTGTPSRMAYLEWSTPEEISPTDLDGVCAHHPAVGHTITREAVEAAASVLSPGEFMRAYANQWMSSLETVIDPKAWQARYTPERIAPGSPVVFGFDATPDRGHASVVAAGRTAAGLTVLEVIDHRPGVAWLAERLAQLHTQWSPLALVADGVGPASAAVDTLRGQGVTVTTTNSREYAVACQHLYDQIHEEPPVGLYAAPGHEALDAAALAAGKRPLGESWAWSRKGAAPISPLIAATLALYGLTRPEEAAPFVI